MTETFKIDFRHQFESIKYALFHLIWLSLLIVILYWTDKITFDNYPYVLAILGSIYLILFLPAFFLHFSYYRENINSVLTIDNNSKCLSISKHNKEITYTYEDIHTVEQYIGIFFMNKIDHRMRRTTPWTNYGYLKLKMKDGHSYFLSSLMLDIFKFPLSVTSTIYCLIPYIDKKEISDTKREASIKANSQEKINKFKKNFAKCSKESLEEKIFNPSKYESEAVTAAKELLEQKSNW